MPKEPLQKKTLNLREGDWDYIESCYKQRGVDTSVVVRTIVSDFVDRMRKREKPAEVDVDAGSINYD